MAVDLTAIGLGVETSKLRQGTKDLDTFGRSANRAAGQADQSTKAMSGMTAIAGKLAIVLGAAGLGKSLIGLVDNYTKLTAQIKNATTTQNEYNQAFSDIQRIAKVAQADLSAVSALYARLNLALKDSGASLKEVGRITESVALTLKAAGASAGETSSVMLQLSQAFGAGALRSEEFNAVAENAPSILRAVATAMRVQVGQLKSMAAEGQITNDVLKEVLGSDAYLESVRNQAKEMQTVSGAWTQLMNDITLAIGQADNVTDASRNIANGIGLISTAIVDLINFMRDNRETIGILLEIYGVAKGASAGAALGSRVGQPVAGGILGGGAALLGIEKMKDAIGSVNRELTRTEELTSKISRSQNIVGNLLSSPLRRNETLDSRNTKVKEYVSNISKYQIELNNLTADIPKIETPTVVSDSELKAAQRAREKIREEAIKDIQNEIDFEMDIKETRDKAELKAIDDAKELQLKADKEVADAREKYLSIEQKRANDNFKEAQDAYKKQTNEYEKIFDRANENLSRSLTDSIIRGFDNGKKWITNFKDAISNAFKGYVVNIGVNFIQNALSGVTGAIGKSIAGVFGMGASGAAVAGGDGVAAAGLLDQAKNIFNVVTKGFDAANASYIGGIKEIGQAISDFGSTGSGFFADTASSLGSSIQLGAEAIGTYLPYAAAILKLAEGDVKGAAFTAAGVAIGNAILPGIGGAIGGFLGSTVGGLFGGKDIPMTGDQAVTKFKDGQLSTSTNTFGKSSLGGGGGLQQANEIFAQSLGSLMKAFGDTSELIVNSIYRSRTNTQGFLYVNGRGVQEGSQKGISFEDFLKKMLGPGLAEAIKRSTAIPLAIRDLFSGIKDYEKVQAMIGAVVALNDASVQLSDRFGLTVENAAKLSKETGLAGDALVAFINKLSGVAQSVKTPAQQILEYKAALTGLLGGSLPATIDAFDSVLKSFNTTTEAGRALFLEMFNLRDAFLQFNNAIAGVKKGVDDAIFSLLSPQQQALQNRARLEEEFAKFNLTVPKTTQQLIAIGEGIDYTTEAGLTLALAFPLLVQAFQAINSEVLKLNNALSPERFRTFTDFVIAQSYSSYGQPIPAANMPSYDVGTSYVPQTGPALLHEGERVVKRSDNAAMTMNSGEVVSLLSALVAKVSVLEYDMKRTADGTQRTARELEDITGGDVTITTQAA